MRRMLWILLFTIGCIERPESPGARYTEVDRASLHDVLVSGTPSPQHPVNAVFNDQIELLGYDVSPEPAAHGSPVTVTYYWRALEPVGEDWKVFVHVDDLARQAGRIIGDHYPAEGRFHTVAWQKGDVVKDAWRFTPLSAGRVELWTGFYIDDKRLPLFRAGTGISDGQNRVRAGAIAIE